MSQARNGMRTRGCGEKSNRGRVCSQHYFLDADARFDHARKSGPNNQGGDGCCNYPTISLSTTTFHWCEPGLLIGQELREELSNRLVRSGGIHRVLDSQDRVRRVPFYRSRCPDERDSGGLLAPRGGVRREPGVGQEQAGRWGRALAMHFKWAN